MDDESVPPPKHSDVPSLKKFNIPKAKTKDLLTKIALDSRDGQDIVQHIQKSLWHPDGMSFEYKTIQTVHNPKLAKEYAAKRKDMREKKYKESDTVDSYAFLLCLSYSDCMEISKNGLTTKRQNRHHVMPAHFMEIGDKKYGVYLSRCADAVSRARHLYDYKSDVFILMFKVIKGRLKQMSPVVSSSDGTEPSPNYDGHVSKEFQLGKQMGLDKVYDAALLYLYEIDLDKFDSENDDMYAKTPRQVLPYAIITLQAKPMVTTPSIPPPPRPKVRAPVAGDRVPVTQPMNVQNRQDVERVFNYEDVLTKTLCLWEGKYYNGRKSNMDLSLHVFTPQPLKLPLKNGQNLCITRKISLQKLQRIFPAKIFRKLPCESLKPTATVDGLKFLHAELHPPFPYDDQLIKKDIAKLHQHFIKHEIAGYCSFPFGCKLYILPTCEFTDKLGITNPDYPNILHCIFMSSFHSTLQPDEMEVFQSTAFKDFLREQRTAFHTRWHDNEELKTFRASPDVVSGKRYCYNVEERRLILNCLSVIKTTFQKSTSQVPDVSTFPPPDRGLTSHQTRIPVDRGLPATTGPPAAPSSVMPVTKKETDMKFDIKMDHKALELLKKTAPDSYEMWITRSGESDATDSDRLVVASDSQDDMTQESNNRPQTSTLPSPPKLPLIKPPLKVSTTKQQGIEDDDEEELVPNSQDTTVESQVSDRTIDDGEIPLLQNNSDVDFHSDSLVIDTGTQSSTSQDNLLSDDSPRKERHPPVDASVVMQALTAINSLCYDKTSPTVTNPASVTTSNFTPISPQLQPVPATTAHASSVTPAPLSMSEKMFQLQGLFGSKKLSASTVATTTTSSTSATSSTKTAIDCTTISDDESPPGSQNRNSTTQQSTSNLSMLKEAMKEKAQTETDVTNDILKLTDISSSGSDFDDGVFNRLLEKRDKKQVESSNVDIPKAYRKHTPKAYQSSESRADSSERSSRRHYRRESGERTRSRSRSRHRHRRSRSRSPRRRYRRSPERSKSPPPTLKDSPFYRLTNVAGTRPEAVSFSTAYSTLIKDKLTSSGVSENNSESTANRLKDSSTSKSTATTTKKKKKKRTPLTSQAKVDAGLKNTGFEAISASESASSLLSDVNLSDVGERLERAAEKVRRTEKNEEEPRDQGDTTRKQKRKTRREREDARKKAAELKTVNTGDSSAGADLDVGRDENLLDPVVVNPVVTMQQEEDDSDSEIIDYRIQKSILAKKKLEEEQANSISKEQEISNLFTTDRPNPTVSTDIAGDIMKSLRKDGKIGVSSSVASNESISSIRKATSNGLNVAQNTQKETSKTVTTSSKKNVSFRIQSKLVSIEKLSPFDNNETSNEQKLTDATTKDEVKKAKVWNKLDTSQVLENTDETTTTINEKREKPTDPRMNKTDKLTPISMDISPLKEYPDTNFALVSSEISQPPPLPVENTFRTYSDSSQPPPLPYEGSNITNHQKPPLPPVTDNTTPVAAPLPPLIATPPPPLLSIPPPLPHVLGQLPLMFPQHSVNQGYTGSGLLQTQPPNFQQQQPSIQLMAGLHYDRPLSAGSYPMMQERSNFMPNHSVQSFFVEQQPVVGVGESPQPGLLPTAPPVQEVLRNNNLISLSQWNSRIKHTELDNFCRGLIEDVAKNF